MSRHSRREISPADLLSRGMPAHFHHWGSSSLIGPEVIPRGLRGTLSANREGGLSTPTPVVGSGACDR